MSESILHVLEKDLKSTEKDLLLMKIVLKESEKQVQFVDEYSEMYYLHDEIKERVNKLEKFKKSLVKKVDSYKKMLPNKKIKFIFFKAGHRSFRSDEISFIVKNLQKFNGEEFFELENIDFQMSDEARLYATEKLEDSEAQFLWETYWLNQFDENDSERYCHGDLMHWNGKELVDENWQPLIK